MTDGVAPVTTRADLALVKALARAFPYERILGKGVDASVTDMAAVEKVERGFFGTLLRLTLLAPEIVQAILNGQQLEGVTLPRLLEPLSTEWPTSAPRSTTNPHAAAALANGQQGVLADEPTGAPTRRPRPL